MASPSDVHDSPSGSDIFSRSGSPQQHRSDQIAAKNDASDVHVREIRVRDPVVRQYSSSGPLYPPSRIRYTEPGQLYTLTKGTILFHGSMHKETFNPFNIKLGDTSSTAAFFSPNKQFAASRVSGCAMYPGKYGGFLHRFVVVQDIQYLRVLSVYEFSKESTPTHLEKMFCNNPINGNRLNGIVMFFPSGDATSASSGFDAEVLLCNTHALKYLGSQRCDKYRSFSAIYDFTTGYPSSVLQPLQPSPAGFSHPSMLRGPPPPPPRSPQRRGSAPAALGSPRGAPPAGTV